MMDFLNESGIIVTITSTVVSVIGALICYLLTILANFFRKKAKEIDNVTAKELAETTINILDTSIQSTIVKVQNDIVDGLKEKSEDGKLTEDEILEIRRTVLDTVKNTLSEESKEVLSKFVGDLDEFVLVLVEQKFNKLKRDGII